MHRKEEKKTSSYHKNPTPQLLQIPYYTHKDTATEPFTAMQHTLVYIYIYMTAGKNMFQTKSCSLLFYEKKGYVMENARVPINNKILNLPFKNTYSSHEWKRKTDFQSLKYGKRQKHKIRGFFSLKKDV